MDGAAHFPTLATSNSGEGGQPTFWPGIADVPRERGYIPRSLLGPLLAWRGGAESDGVGHHVQYTVKCGLAMHAHSTTSTGNLAGKHWLPRREFNPVGMEGDGSMREPGFGWIRLVREVYPPSQLK